VVHKLIVQQVARSKGITSMGGLQHINQDNIRNIAEFLMTLIGSEPPEMEES
jgi:hypothetical protein